MVISYIGFSGLFGQHKAITETQSSVVLVVYGNGLV